MNPVDFWKGRRVVVTGHTGFKGAWLAFWLAELGAEVWGLSLPPESAPNLFMQLGLDGLTHSTLSDINDRPALDRFLSRAKPDVVFHLAAQALVRPSYVRPVETFATNVLGTVQLLDALRSVGSVRAIIVVTSDKAYENHEWPWGYREIDELGGHDPYSGSKGAAEIAVRSMRRSFFAPSAAGGHPARIATVRAGNVIGGGDWSVDRLVPDIVRSCMDSDGVVELRNPASTRPWQHVLEPLGFYMGLASRLCTAPDGMDTSWNVGPDRSDCRSVRSVAEAMIKALGRGRLVERGSGTAPHEARLLELDCAKARALMGWRPRWSFDETISMTASWYAAWHRGEDPVATTRAQVGAYMAKLPVTP